MFLHKAYYKRFILVKGIFHNYAILIIQSIVQARTLSVRMIKTQSKKMWNYEDKKYFLTVHYTVLAKREIALFVGVLE